MVLCFLSPARVMVEIAEAEMAVREEGAHPELGGQRQGLSITTIGRFHVGRDLARVDVAQDPQRVGFDAPLLVGAAQEQSPLSRLQRIGEPTRQPIDCAQRHEAWRVNGHHPHGAELLRRLLDQF